VEQGVGPAIRRVAAQASSRRAPIGLIVIGALLALAMALPLVYLLITVLQSLPAALETIWNWRTAGLVARSVGLTIAVTATATLIALPVAWLTGRTDLPGRRIWLVVALLPLVVPSYIGAYAFISAFGPSGLLQDILAGPFGVERLPSIIGFPGAWIVLSLFTYPLVLLPVRTAMSRLDPQLEDAASVMGRSPFRVFTSAVLPQLAPAIAAGAVLVALYTLHDFGAVSIMRFDSFTREIYLNYRASFDRIGAASLSLLLVAIMLVLVWVEGRTRL
jgi:iron(III) transport system permease protein